MIPPAAKLERLRPDTPVGVPAGELLRQADLIVELSKVVNGHARTIVRQRVELETLRAELSKFKPQPMSQRCRDGIHASTGEWACHNCRCLCHVAALEVTG